MKTIYPLIALACGLLWSSRAVASDTLSIGPATVNFSCKAQELNFQDSSAKTNIVGSNTNVTLLAKSTETNFTLNADSFLVLLANSFSTNFPPGAKLLLRTDFGNIGFAVSDGTGTNIFMLVGSVFSAANQGLVNAGMLTESVTNGVFSTGNDTEAFTAAGHMGYSDSLMTTADGTVTSLTLNYFVQTKLSRNLATLAVTENVSITVTGGGIIRSSGHSVVISGTIHGTTKGIIPSA